MHVLLFAFYFEKKKSCLTDSVPDSTLSAELDFFFCLRQRSVFDTFFFVLTINYACL